MLQYKTIEPATLELLKVLQALPLLKETRLVGGTALALQLGHRKSVDLDFFGDLAIPFEEIHQILAAQHDITVIQKSKNINIYEVDHVKIDFVNYSYEWIDDVILEEGVRLASLKDIAAMKVTAIIGRGTKKDFIDLFYLLKYFSLEEILGFYQEKYPDGSMFLAMKSLSYFNDAEADPMPYMFTDDSWDYIKESIKKEVINYVRRI